MSTTTAILTRHEAIVTKLDALIAAGTVVLDYTYGAPAGCWRITVQIGTGTDTYHFRGSQAAYPFVDGLAVGAGIMEAIEIV